MVPYTQNTPPEPPKSPGPATVQPARVTAAQSSAGQNRLHADTVGEPGRGTPAPAASAVPGLRTGRTRSASPSGKQTRYRLTLILLIVLGAVLLVGLIVLLVHVLTPPDVEKVVLRGEMDRIIVGQTAQLSAEIYPQEAEATLRWSSSDPEIAAVDNKGNLTPVAGGTCTITAEAGGKTASFDLLVLAVTGVTIDEHVDAICIGETARFKASVHPDEVANRPVTWTSSAPTIAAVDESGLVTPKTPGTCTIRAAADGKSDAVSLTVYAVTDVSFTSAPRELRVGQTVRPELRIKPDEAAGKTPVTWTSSNPAAATVDETGLVTSVSTGSAVITATAGGKSDSFNLETYVVSSVEIPDGPRELTVGETLQLTAKLLPREAADTPVTWRSSNPEIATIDAEGNITPVTNGNCTFTVEVDGKTANVNFVIYAVTGITIDEGPRDLIVGETGALTATIEPESAVGTTRVYWKSSDPSVAIISETGMLTPVSPGTCTITVEAGGRSDEAAFTVYEISEITVSGADRQLYVGDTAQLKAEIEPRQAAGAKVTWRSSDPSVVSVDANGALTIKAVGSCTITASAGRKSGLASFQVLTVSDLSLSGGSRDLCIDESTNLTAALQPAQAADFPVTWTSSDTSVARVDESGHVTPVGAGTVTITATAETKSDSVTITVRKYNRMEKKILGSWSYNDGFLSSIFGGSMKMSLNGDLSGSVSADGSSNSFSWSYSGQSGDRITYSMSGFGSSYMVYDESSDTLTLYLEDGASSSTLVFHRN